MMTNTKSVSVKSITANVHRPHSFKNAIVTRALPKGVKLPVWDWTETLEEHEYDGAYGFAKDLLDDRGASFETDHLGFGEDARYVSGQEILNCLKPGVYPYLPTYVEFGIHSSRRQNSDTWSFYTNCAYILKLWVNHCFEDIFYEDWHDEIIIKDMREKASYYAEKAKDVKKDCEALYEEVKDFISSVEGTLWENDCDDPTIYLKDNYDIRFVTDTENYYEDGDTEVTVRDEDGDDVEYRDDFVDKHTHAMIEQWNDLEGDYDCDAFGDEVNDAGDLYFFSLIKTALTVAKERMAEWDGIDHTVDDDDCEDEAVAE